MAATVLMVAFHFPPAAMGSGHLRTLGFARYLPGLGWNPVVLSASALAYPCTSPIAPGMIPEGCEVHRALAFDASRHFGIAGKYPGILAVPDRWSSWRLAAVHQGLRLIRRHQVKAIWSTYPIMSAHCIAHTLARKTGLPWIADFRDPVATSVAGIHARALASQQRWEARVMHDARRIVFTTAGALEACAKKYPEAHAAGRLQLIGNGFDEVAFAQLPLATGPSDARPLLLVHSGQLYAGGRDPLPFFHALAQLKAAGEAIATRLKVVLRGSGNEDHYQRELDRLGVSDIVALAPQVGNHEALVEQASADALLLFQGPRFDRQIPAKMYEYVRIGRPIFALLGAHGDTAVALRRTGGAELVAIDDVAAIAAGLRGFLNALRTGSAPVARREVLPQYARSAGAAVLATMLDQVVSGRPGASNHAGLGGRASAAASTVSRTTNH